MANRPDPSRSIAVAGEEYDTVTCAWCGGYCIVLADKRGRPYSRCQTCDSRSFATMACWELAKLDDRVTALVWPPEEAVSG